MIKVIHTKLSGLWIVAILLLSITHGYAQQQPIISGNVKDQDGMSLTGVTVRVKGQNTQVMTDEEGN